MKRYFPLYLAAGFAVACLTGCGSTAPAAPDTSGTLRVVTTIFPEYDWTRHLMDGVSDGQDCTLLVANGVDLHSYQPSVSDLAAIADCDVFVYVGGESDSWVKDALNSSPNPDRQVVCLMDALGDAVKEEEFVEGMQGEDHDHDEDDHDDVYDEHVWLSLRNAKVLCEAITDALCAADPDHAAAYTANLDAYRAELDALDGEFAAMVDAAPRDTILVADRFPFLYLADDYDLDYYAAFVGCSAETEASFETVTFLANKVDELGLPYVLTLEKSDQKLAQTVVNSTAGKNQQLLTLQSLQSVSAAEIEAGADYLGLMRENLVALEKALGN